MSETTLDLATVVRRLLVAEIAHVNGIRIGVDVVDVDLMSRQIGSAHGQAFLSRIFTAQELDDCAGTPQRLAARWAAKEAVAKAIGSGFRGLEPRMIEIVKAASGQPTVRAATDHVWPQRAHTWKWEISMAHDSSVALAVALGLEGGDAID